MVEVKNIKYKIAGFIVIIFLLVPGSHLSLESANNSHPIIINSLEGNVEIKIDKKFLNFIPISYWKELDSDSLLYPGDKIRTGVDAFLELQFSDSVFILVDENTEFLIQENEISENSENNSVFLEKGRIWSRVKKIYQDLTSFEVETPDAVAGVRGTLFSVFVDNGKAVVSVKEGAVAFESSDRGQSVFIEKEQMGKMTNGILELVEEITEEENEKWQNRDIIKWTQKIENLEKGIGQIISEIAKEKVPGQEKKEDDSSGKNSSNPGKSGDEIENPPGQSEDNSAPDTPGKSDNKPGQGNSYNNNSNKKRG